MATEDNPYERLRNFLKDAFLVPELDMFLRLKGFVEVAQSVNPGLAAIPYCFNVVQALDNRGLIDKRFFELLRQERPNKKPQISSLEQFWLDKKRDPINPDATIISGGPQITTPANSTSPRGPSSAPHLGARTLPHHPPPEATNHPISVFMSYSRKDKRLRDLLEIHLTTLTREGLIASWHDRMIEPGMEWAREIDEHLESARLILLLVSMDFIASAYCYEIEMTRALQKHRDGEACVIPVILRPSDWQKTPFGALNALPEGGRPVTTWRDRDEALLSITQGIRSVVERIQEGQPPLPPRNDPIVDRSELLPGLSSKTPVGNVLPKLGADPIPGTGVIPILETGTVALDSPFYEPRDSDSRAVAQLGSNNPTVVIKGSRQSGKSSLLARLSDAATQQGNRSCYLNLLDVGKESLTSDSRLCLRLARMIVRELGLGKESDREGISLIEGDPDQPWLALTNFLEDVVLGSEPTRLLLIFDEVDVAFDYPDLREDLFTMIRSWHERRQRARMGNRWKSLQLALAHATNPALWIKNLSQSPFNVGLRLVLEEFNDQQVADLNGKHGSPLAGPPEVRRLMALVGGHPHLVRIALYTLAAERWSLDYLENVSCDPGSPFAQHLDDYLSAISRDPVLITAVVSILKRGVCSDDQIFQKLWAAGLIRGKSPNAVNMRCTLYHNFFSKRL